MTEAEWLTNDDPVQMLRSLHGRATDRQYRLFAVACARDELDQAHKTQSCFNFGLIGADMKELFWDPVRGYEAAIRDAEAWADGREAQRTASSWWFVGWYKGIDNVADIAYAALGYDPDGLVNVSPEVIAKTIRGYQTNPAHYLRDIFGNPFRPVTLNPSWLTSTVLALAQQMYDSRDFSPMPILADALQDAGCDNEEILNHCRQPGEHVRGCFAVDLLLSKE
jgi:hypothetical protein